MKCLTAKNNLSLSNTIKKSYFKQRHLLKFKGALGYHTDIVNMQLHHKNLNFNAKKNATIYVG